MARYEIEPEPEVAEALASGRWDVDGLVREAIRYMDGPDVDHPSLARMFTERGIPEPVSYFLVRLAEVRHAPGELPTPSTPEG